MHVQGTLADRAMLQGRASTCTGSAARSDSPGAAAYLPFQPWIATSCPRHSSPRTCTLSHPQPCLQQGRLEVFQQGLDEYWVGRPAEKAGLHYRYKPPLPRPRLQRGCEAAGSCAAGVGAGQLVGAHVKVHTTFCLLQRFLQHWRDGGSTAAPCVCNAPQHLSCDDPAQQAKQMASAPRVTAVHLPASKCRREQRHVGQRCNPSDR